MLSDNDKALLDEIMSKIREANYVSFNDSIEKLRGRRALLQKSEIESDETTAEFCYHLISILQECEKLVNDNKFSSHYIEEHCFILGKYAKQLGEETDRDHDNQPTKQQ